MEKHGTKQEKQGIWTRPSLIAKDPKGSKKENSPILVIGSQPGKIENVNSNN
jgi:hypothetical protein